MICVQFVLVPGGDVCDRIFPNIGKKNKIHLDWYTRDRIKISGQRNPAFLKERVCSGVFCCLQERREEVGIQLGVFRVLEIRRHENNVWTQAGKRGGEANFKIPPMKVGWVFLANEKSCS